MNPGAFRHRVSIQRPDTTQNEYGEQTESWIEVAVLHMSIEPIVGREFFAAETVNSELTHRLRGRYRYPIQPSWRVVFGDRTFHIKSVINYKELGAEVQLMCRELV